MNKPKPTPLYSQSNQSGFTIIESLIAIIVVTILMVGLAPILTLAVANRVQARRVELATQAAKSYIDGVRSGAIPFGDNPANGENAITADNNKSSGDNLSDVPAPITKGKLSCNSPDSKPYCNSPAAPTGSIFYCVDGDNPPNDCDSTSNKDFIIQAFGKITTDGNNSVNAAQNYLNYSLGVRVYRADAFTSEFVKGFGKEGTQSTFTGGTGLTATQYPLVQMATEIPVNNPSKFRDLCTQRGIGGC